VSCSGLLVRDKGIKEEGEQVSTGAGLYGITGESEFEINEIYRCL
jgi:hypothetical protein